MTVSELEGRLQSLQGEARRLGCAPADLCRRFAVPLAKDANRLGIVDDVMTDLVGVLQVDQDQARQQLTQAQESIMDMLQSDIILAARMAHLEDAFDARDRVAPGRLEELASRPPPDYSVPAASGDRLPDYAEAMASLDASVALRPHSWSVFSGLTLADVSSTALIPLPLVHTEIHGGECYAPGYADSARAILGDTPERSRSRPVSSRSLLGPPRDAGDDGGGQVGFVRRLALRCGRSRSYSPSPS
ncbi:hypothetical protein CDD83_10116 [Cordyceps sp. RAO-2017]|nr:hypothetical protein CDD83_10116 [Cordyceps sp. RAO-2017]